MAELPRHGLIVTGRTLIDKATKDNLGNLRNSGSANICCRIWINNGVGGNSVWANLFASIVGAFKYFATLTETPILKGRTV
jgi:hypothetical protein